MKMQNIKQPKDIKKWSKKSRETFLLKTFEKYIVQEVIGTYLK